MAGPALIPNAARECRLLSPSLASPTRSACRQHVEVAAPPAIVVRTSQSGPRSQAPNPRRSPSLLRRRAPRPENFRCQHSQSAFAASAGVVASREMCFIRDHASKARPRGERLLHRSKKQRQPTGSATGGSFAQPFIGRLRSARTVPERVSTTRSALMRRLPPSTKA